LRGGLFSGTAPCDGTPVDGKPIAQGRMERTIPFRISADETLEIGEGTGTPASEEY